MQESKETLISNHLDEIVAAVSITPGKKIQNKLPQTALFQPPREKLHHCEEKAKSYSSCHEYKQAVRELVRCVALTRICYGDSHWKLAEAHVNLAQGYLQLKGLSLQARQHAEKAKEILTNSIQPPYDNDTDVFKCSIELFHTMGRALLSLQKFKEASENLSKAERLAKELLQCGRIIKEEWIEIQARIKLSSAQMYQSQKKSKEALPHYQEALEYIESSRGEKSLECVPILRELASVEQALGLHDASVNHFLQAHLIVLSKNPSQEEAAVSAHFVAHAAVASGSTQHQESNLDPERVPRSQSGSVWRSQSRGGRDLQAVGWGRPGPGEPRWGPQETEEVSSDSDPLVRSAGQEDSGHPADGGRPVQDPRGGGEVQAGPKSQTSVLHGHGPAHCAGEGQAQHGRLRPPHPPNSPPRRESFGHAWALTLR
ncbi:tetratricopeptide repeat protein 23 isoform X2 [Mustela nigripes]|uniref:tetratricopeptide repeat protein 23 isoform X2 n=1 Tax=Mustela nigripes TaxID=77151 RepID=UPI0028165417|nr:tetratricopeptide repeat protein 23 isoform X2 [Mustela nigripes]